MKKLERMNTEKLRSQMSSLAPTKSQQVLANESIKQELLNTKSVPLVSFKEKVTFLSTLIDKQTLDLVQTFDVITSYLNICQTVDKAMLATLFEKLKTFLTSTLEEVMNEFLKAAANRCLRKVL